MIAYGIILAGGNGERFWPLSTAKRPKQFLDIFDGKPLIRHAVDRLEGLIPPERILVITAERFVKLTQEMLPMVPAANVVGEPCARNTAAAVAVAAGLVRKLGGDDAVGCVLTADHMITPATRFRATLKDAIRAASQTNAIVTLGVVPNAPETGYGYIKIGAPADVPTGTTFYAVDRFVEKPDVQTARQFLKDGGYYWNAGMFVWTAATMAKAYADFAPDIAEVLDEVAASDNVAATLKKLYPDLRSTSVDFAVMEHVKNVLVAQCNFNWSDVGNWLSLPTFFSRDVSGNTRLGHTALLDTSGSIVVSDAAHPVGVVGLDNVVVVHTANGTLVCAKDRVQDIKKLLRELLPR